MPVTVTSYHPQREEGFNTATDYLNPDVQAEINAILAANGGTSEGLPVETHAHLRQFIAVRRCPHVVSLPPVIESDPFAHKRNIPGFKA